MPVYVAPYSDSLRQTFLKKSLETAASDAAAGIHLISQTLVDELTAFFPDFNEKVKSVNSALGGRMRETNEAQEAVNLLSVYIRDFWEVLRRRTARMNHSIDVLAYYGLSQDGYNPAVTVREEWLTIAERLVEGEKTALSRGFPPMSNPSVAEVTAMAESARKELSEISGADRVYDAAQKAAAALRPRADELITEVMDELRFALRKQNPSNQRRVMRSYGANYRYLPGEQAEEAEEPTPPQNQ